MNSTRLLRPAAVEQAIRGIFERRYFANNGPLVRELDATFAKMHAVEHAVSVVNFDVAFAILAKALAPSGGEAILPATSAEGTIDAVTWAGLVPRSETNATGSVTLILTDRSAGRGDLARLQELAELRGCPLIVDATLSVGDSSVFRYGAAAIASLGKHDACYGGEGAVVTTNDGHLADALRTMRNFHAGETFCEVSLRINGKMSEAQAALALCSLAALTSEGQEPPA